MGSSSVPWLWNWTNAVPFPDPDQGIRVTLESTCTGDVIVPDFSSSDTTYCDTALLPKTVANMEEPDPYVPSTSGDDDDGDDINTTVAIVTSISVALVFLAAVGYCLHSRRAATAGGSSSDPTKSNSNGMRTSLLSASEKQVAASDSSNGGARKSTYSDRLFLRDESRNSAESVEL